ncbi:MAG: acyl-CoA thioesterase [Verrucomicrobia bacterium]|nr:acyl-CoA thioesterase [Verrucomicrobiota bacterium]
MFKHQIRVSYRDVTVGNHVYYSRYLDLLEIARNEAFREMGHPLLALQEKGVIFPVVECVLRYHAPARYDDLLDIETGVLEIGRVRMTLAYRVRRSETLLVTASTLHAATGLDEKPVRIPSDLQAVLQSHFEKPSGSP